MRSNRLGAGVNGPSAGGTGAPWRPARVRIVIACRSNLVARGSGLISSGARGLRLVWPGSVRVASCAGRRLAVGESGDGHGDAGGDLVEQVDFLPRQPAAFADGEPL